MGIVRDLFMARKAGAGTKLPAPTVASLVKRLMLASIIGGTGEQKTVSGNAPLTLELALEHDIISLTQYGLCTQADTPTLAVPVPIKCNNGTLTAVDDELPTGYNRVLGFSCNNNAMWEITDFHLKGSDTVRIGFSVTAACNVFGCYQGADATDNYDLYVSTTANSKYLRYGNGTYLSYWGSADLGERFDAVFSPTGTQGMPQDSTWTELDFESANDLLIGSTTMTGTSAKLKGNLYGNIVVDGRLKLIPCERLSDNVLGYYDTIGQTFYGPATGFDGATSLGYDYSHYQIQGAGTPEVLTIKPGVHFTLSSGDFESGSINESGEEIEDANSVRTKGFIKVDPGTDYIVVLLTDNNKQLVMPIAEYSSEEVFIKRDTPAGARGRLITTENDTGKIRIIVNCADSFPPWSITSVSLDTTLSSYNPAGKNLYSHQNSIFGDYLSSSGVPTIGARACYSCKIPVDPAKSYTWSGISGEAGLNNKRACFYKSDDTFISAQGTSVQGKNSPYTFTFTPPANTAYCRLSLNTADADVMLEEGSSKTTFEPYRDADWQTASVVDLLSVGDYKDEHEIISGPVKRKCAACVYDGTQVIGDVYMSETGGKDVGAIIVYPVSATTESVAAQPLSTIQGGNIISVIAEVSPIALSVTYFADGTVNNRQALRILLGDSYSNQGTTDDVSDKEALDIILGGNK